MHKFSKEINQILKEIQTKNRFILTSHINPDGDGLGSELALYYFLKDQNKDVRIINDSPVPEMYQFMDPEKKFFKHYDPSDNEHIINADVIFVLDISVLHRLGEISKVIEQSSAVCICIDHHMKNNFNGNILFIDDTAVATGELVFLLLKQSGCHISQEIAEALYITLLTDTGCFGFSNTNARAHFIAAELLKLGANHHKVYNNLFENNSWRKTRLYANTIGTLEEVAGGRIAVMHITNQMMKESGAAYEDIEGFSEFARNIKGVLISILFVEHPDNKVKLSFRSSGDMLVDLLASEFGGGGHKNASAAMLHSISFSSAKEKVIDAATRFIEKN